MKAIKKYSRAFLPCAIASIALIIFGFIGLFVRGINFGIDFVPGIVEEVKIAPAAIEVKYNGTANAVIETSSTDISIILSGTNAENQTSTFTFGQNPTVNDIAKALSSVKGVSAKVLSGGDVDSYAIYTNSAVSTTLSSDNAYLLYVPNPNSSITVDEVRETLAVVNANVKVLGKDGDISYQIRCVSSDDESENVIIQDTISNLLIEKYGKDDVAVIKTDFVASSFSSSLVLKSILLSILTIFMIWLYATIRFHWDFALASVVALLHDFFIMIMFISWAQIEFSVTSLAAVLTIFGYSINATVVILDRVRQNIKLMEVKSFNEILNASINQTMQRSLITTFTTLLASLSLWIFTTGSIRDFAIILTVGLISGCYSSIFISSGVISLARKNWHPSQPNRVRPRAETLVSVSNKEEL